MTASIYKLKLSCGNQKIGKDTLIINITSATNCMSAKLGMCQLLNTNKCYALKAERQYPSVLPYRQAQTIQWDRYNVQGLADRILKTACSSRRKIRIKYLRFSEAGDFRKQADVDKMSALADYLAPHGIKVYGYTARKDLDYSHLSPNMVVSGSGFMVSNQFTAVSKPSGKHVCAGNCRVCNLCKHNGHKSIGVKLH